MSGAQSVDDLLAELLGEDEVSLPFQDPDSDIEDWYSP
jgi:hypothetical protein